MHADFSNSFLIFIFRECSRIFGEDGLTLKLFLKKTAPFSILWTLTNYLYLLALKKLTATDVSALFCCNKAFVFLLSWIVLKDRFMGVRVMVTYAILCQHYCQHPVNLLPFLRIRYGHSDECSLFFISLVVNCVKKKRLPVLGTDQNYILNRIQIMG